MRSGVAFVGLICIFAMAPFAAGSAPAAETTPVPDLSGSWARVTFAYEWPQSGPGPIGSVNGRRGLVGNYKSPTLRPEAAALVKQRAETLLAGADYPTPSNRCLTMVSPYLIRVQEVQVLQKADEVIFLYMQDHQVRRVRLNRPHPANVPPSLYGDAVGHYEGGTLVVDTVGVKVGEVPILDMYGTPYSEALHVVERYRLVDYEAAKEAQARNLRDSGPVATEQGASIDEDYKGKGLQVQFTVEDRNVFTTPWSAGATYRRAADWVENVCAENTHEYYNNSVTKVPEAAKPDF